MFVNLYFGCPQFKDENCTDVLDRHEFVNDSYIRRCLLECYQTGEIPEPALRMTIRLTLSRAASEAFFRMVPGALGGYRDYALSKVFQFLWVPMQCKFDVGEYDDDGEGSDVRTRLESLLVRIPEDQLARLSESDEWWQDFYSDTLSNNLEGVLSRMPQVLSIPAVGTLGTGVITPLKACFIALRKETGSPSWKAFAGLCGVKYRWFMEIKAGKKPGEETLLIMEENLSKELKRQVVLPKPGN